MRLSQTLGLSILLGCSDETRILDPGLSSRCGDGVREGDELCDEGALNDGRYSGCNLDCTFAPSCGDGIVDVIEDCDDGARNSATEPGACRRDCQRASCGDGVRDPHEVCLGRTELFAFAEPWAEMDRVSTRDLNGDGLDDLMISERAGYTETTTITAWMNRGGRFESTWSVELSRLNPPAWVEDLDGDGTNDLLIIGTSTGSLWRGQGDGTFAEPDFFETLASCPSCQGLQDLDGNGLLDLLFCDLHEFAAPPTLYVLLNLGERFDRVPSTIDLPAGQWWSPSIVDVDGDDRLDLMLHPNEETSALWARGNGDGSFEPPSVLFARDDLRSLLPWHFDNQPPIDFFAVLTNEDFLPLRSEQAQLVEIGPPLEVEYSTTTGLDLEGDGIFELADITQGQIRIRRTPSGEVVHALRASPGTERVGRWDWDRDGRMDLVEFAVHNIYIRELSDERVGEPVRFQFDRNVLGFELDGDESPDFIADNSVSIGFVRGRNLPEAISVNHEWDSIRRIELADVDLDGVVDIVAMTYFDLLLWRGRGGGQLAETEVIGEPASELAIGDFNGDGIPDLARSSDGTIGIERGRGNGSFATIGTATVSGEVRAMRVADVTGDGPSDLVVLASNQIHLFPSADLSAVLRYDGGTIAGVDDVDGDERADLLIADQEEIRWLLGDPSGFVAGGSLPIVSACCAAAGDFDGDGLIDLAVADDDLLHIHPGIGVGRFGPSLRVEIPFSPRRVERANLDGDGIDDLLLWSAFDREPTGMPAPEWSRQDYATTILGQPDRALVPKTFFLRRQVLDMALGDLDGDQLPDLATCATDAGLVPKLPPEITVYLSNP